MIVAEKRQWLTELNAKLVCVAWSPDDRTILAADCQGVCHVLDSKGDWLKKIQWTSAVGILATVGLISNLSMPSRLWLCLADGGRKSRYSDEHGLAIG